MPKMKRRKFLQMGAAAGSSLVAVATTAAQTTERGSSAPRLAAGSSVPLPMDNYLAQHDLIYERAPRQWEEGIPLGNGDMGALIWGSGRPLRITLDKYDVWELRTQDPTDPRYNYKGLRQLIASKQFDEAIRVFEERDPMKPAPTRLPLPRMELDFGQQPSSYTARLVLHDGLVRGTLGFTSGQLSWEAFLHAEKNLLVVRLTLPTGVQLKNLKVDLNHLDHEAKKRLRSWGYPEPETGQHAGRAWLEQRLPEHGRYVVMWEKISTGPQMAILTTVVYNPDGADPKPEAEANLTQAARQSRQVLLAEHTRFWHRHWQKCFLTVPDAKLENLFYVEMYKLACSSRPGKFPISLQAIWTKDGSLPPWAGDYHLDMNVQESYWPVYASNHLDYGQPLYERFFKNLPRYQQMCRGFFGFEGAWSRCEQAIDGSPIYGWYTANFWPGNGAWLAQHFWLHWLYSRDKNFLRERAFPFLKAFMQTYCNLLEEGPDGRLHIPLSHSPEWGNNGGGAWGSDVTGDLALIRWLGATLIESAEILQVDDSNLPRWRETLRRLTDYPQDRSGLMLWAGQPLTESHRHHTHLLAIHPLGILNIESSEEERKLIFRSLATIRERGTGAWTGWSFPWMSLIASRVAEPYMAWNMLQEYLFFISVNTFHWNGDPRHFGPSRFDYTPMTLEAGFAFAAALMEMLLQSWGGRIRVFPTVPEFWPSAYFESLRAEGAFLVTARREEGQTLFVEILSEAGGRCRVKNPFRGRGVVLTGALGAKQTLRGELLEFDTQAGNTYLLTAEGSPSTSPTRPPLRARMPEASNWFGVKKIARF